MFMQQINQKKNNNKKNYVFTQDELVKSRT